MYCSLCLTEVTDVQSLDSGRCRHVFCSRCISYLTEYEVVTCPYDLSAMLVSQLRPNIELMRKTAHLSLLQSRRPAGWQADAQRCCIDMRKCVNLQGVPCKAAVHGRCTDELCPYEHRAEVLKRARDIAQKVAFAGICQTVSSQEGSDDLSADAPLPLKAATPPPPTPTARSAMGICGWFCYLFDWLIVSWVLFVVQLTLYLLILWLCLLEKVMSATKFRVSGVVKTVGLAGAQTIRLPLVLFSWILMKFILLVHYLSKHTRAPPIPSRLLSLLSSYTSKRLS